MMLVVLFAVLSAATASLVPAQPAYLPAIVLDPHGRPLETAEVINARALHLQAKALEHTVPLAHGYLASPFGHYLKKRSLGYLAPIIAPQVNYVGGQALTHQSRVDVHSSPAVVAHSVVSPLVSTYSALPAYGHLLKKRSVALTHGYSSPILAHAAPIAVAHAIPSAVSHQSRVDVHSSPAIVSQSIVAPVVSHSVVASPVVSAYSSWPAYGSYGHYLKKRSLGYLAAPIISTNYLGGSALTHQSRLDVHSSPALVSQSVISPVISAYSAWPTHGSYGHYLKKRSLGYLTPIAPQVNYIGGSALTHESRVDVRSPGVVSQSVVAPLVSTYSALPVYGHGHLLKKRSLALGYGLPAVSHQARVDVISSHGASILAHATPVAVAHAAPIVAQVVAPAAVSHQSRVDVVSSPSIYKTVGLSYW